MQVKKIIQATNSLDIISEIGENETPDDGYATDKLVLLNVKKNIQTIKPLKQSLLLK